MLVYVKRDVLIVNFPFLSGNVPRRPLMVSIDLNFFAVLEHILMLVVLPNSLSKPIGIINFAQHFQNLNEDSMS